MARDLRMSATAFGLGGGLFFVTCFLFEVPSNLLLEQVGARRWIARIMITWGIVAAAMATVTDELSFCQGKRPKFEKRADLAVLGQTEIAYDPTVNWSRHQNACLTLAKRSLATSRAKPKSLSKRMASSPGNWGCASACVKKVAMYSSASMATVAIGNGNSSCAWLTIPCARLGGYLFAPTMPKPRVLWTLQPNRAGNPDLRRTLRAG
jgi:hypothetical protein